MKELTHIALIGDYNEAITAHRAIPLALQMAAETLGQAIELSWIGTEQIRETQDVAGFDGYWCVPGSPYHNMDGALLAIRYAREQGKPFLGTCGGFQHAVIEYARNVLGWQDADHAETAVAGARMVISQLSCSLVEVADAILLQPDRKITAIYGTHEIQEGYHCNFGLNPSFNMAQGPLRVGGLDRNGEVRALELDDHPFFIITLFQGERAALNGTTPPLAKALLQACLLCKA